MWMPKHRLARGIYEDSILQPPEPIPKLRSCKCWQYHKHAEGKQNGFLRVSQMHIIAHTQTYYSETKQSFWIFFICFLFFYFEFLEAKEKEKSVENAVSHEWQRNYYCSSLTERFCYYWGFPRNIFFHEKFDLASKARADTEEALTATQQDRECLYKTQRGQI